MVTRTTLTILQQVAATKLNQVTSAAETKVVFRVKETSDLQQTGLLQIQDFLTKQAEQLEKKQ